MQSQMRILSIPPASSMPAGSAVLMSVNGTQKSESDHLLDRCDVCFRFINWLVFEG